MFDGSPSHAATSTVIEVTEIDSRSLDEVFEGHKPNHQMTLVEGGGLTNMKSESRIVANDPTISNHSTGKDDNHTDRSRWNDEKTDTLSGSFSGDNTGTRSSNSLTCIHRETDLALNEISPEKTKF